MHSSSPITKTVTMGPTGKRDATHAFITNNAPSDNSLDPVYYTKERDNEHKRHLAIRLNKIEGSNTSLFIPSPGDTTQIIDQLLVCIAEGDLSDSNIRKTIFPFLAQFLKLQLPELEEQIRQRAFSSKGDYEYEIKTKFLFLKRLGIMNSFDAIYYAAKNKNKKALTSLLNSNKNIIHSLPFHAPSYRLAFEGDLDSALFLKQESGGYSDQIALGLIRGKHFNKAIDFLNSEKNTATKNIIVHGMILGYATLGSFEKSFELLKSLPNKLQKEISRKINYYAAFGGHEDFVNRAISNQNLSKTTDLLQIMHFYAMGGHAKKALSLLSLMQWESKSQALAMTDDKFAEDNLLDDNPIWTFALNRVLDLISLIESINPRKNALEAIATGCIISGDIVQDSHPVWAFALNDDEKLGISIGIAKGYASIQKPEDAMYLVDKADKKDRPLIEFAIAQSLVEHGYITEAVLKCHLSPDIDEKQISGILKKIKSYEALKIFIYNFVRDHPQRERLDLTNILLSQWNFESAMIALNAEAFYSDIRISNRKSNPDLVKSIDENIRYLLKKRDGSLKQYSYDFIKFAINPNNCDEILYNLIQTQLIKITTAPTANSMFSLFSSENSDNKLYSFYLHLLLKRDTIFYSKKSLDQTIIAMAEEYHLPAADMEFLKEHAKPSANKQEANNAESKHDATPSIETIASIVTTPPNKHSYLKIRAIDPAEDKLDDLDKILAWDNDVATPTAVSNTRR